MVFIDQFDYRIIHGTLNIFLQFFWVKNNHYMQYTGEMTKLILLCSAYLATAKHIWFHATCACVTNVWSHMLFFCVNHTKCVPDKKKKDLSHISTMPYDKVQPWWSCILHIVVSETSRKSMPHVHFFIQQVSPQGISWIRFRKWNVTCVHRHTAWFCSDFMWCCLARYICTVRVITPLLLLVFWQCFFILISSKFFISYTVHEERQLFQWCTKSNFLLNHQICHLLQEFREVSYCIHIQCLQNISYLGYYSQF